MFTYVASFLVQLNPLCVEFFLGSVGPDPVFELHRVPQPKVRSPCLVDYMDHSEWAYVRFGVRATNWLATKDYWEAWSCRYRARGNKVHCLHIKKGLHTKMKNMSKFFYVLKTHPLPSKWSSFNTVSECCCLMQVLSPKDTKELTESCPEALAAAEEFTKSAKSSEAWCYLLGLSLESILHFKVLVQAGS